VEITAFKQIVGSYLALQNKLMHSIRFVTLFVTNVVQKLVDGSHRFGGPNRNVSGTGFWDCVPNM